MAMRRLALLAAAAALAIALGLPPPPQLDAPRERAREAQRGAPGESAFWHWRVAYPTGQFEPRWYDRALAQHRALAKGMPERPLAKDLAAGVLDPARATALGPAPLTEGGYGHVA